MVSPWVATTSPWVAAVPPGSHGRAAPAQPPSPAPRCHHPTGAGVLVLPLCPPATPRPAGQVIPQPHIPVLTGVPCQPGHGDQRNLILGAFFVPCHKAQLPLSDARGQGGLCPPTSPTAPSPLAGGGSPLPHPPGWGLSPLRLPVPAGPPSSLPPRRRQVRASTGAGSSPDCPLIPRGWPAVSPWCACGWLCWCHGWPKVSLWLATVSPWVASGVTMGGHRWPPCSPGTGSPAPRPHCGCCLGMRWPSPPATADWQGGGPMGTGDFGGPLTSSSPPERCS